MNLPDGRRLLPALLAFERSPGRFPVALREPRPLFAHIGSVMRLAAGRPVEGLPMAASSNLELRRAARFFVRTVMLRPGTDPYTLLGLTPDFEPVQLREHYRLMIRLTHPDYGATTGERWPADAAVRVNQAKDLLSSPEKQAAYEAALRRQPRRGLVHAGAFAPQPAKRLLMQPAVCDKAAPRPTPLRRSLRARWATAASNAVLTAGSFLRKVLKP